MGIRSGTENIPYIYALGYASELMYKELKSENERLLHLSRYFKNKLDLHYKKQYIINGSLQHRLPNNLNIGLMGANSSNLITDLAEYSVYVSAGAACHEGKLKVSPVIEALKIDTSKYGILRISFGLKTKISDIDYFF